MGRLLVVQAVVVVSVFFLVGCGGGGGGGGVEPWAKSYSGADNDYPSSIRQTSDGGYVIAGRSYSAIADYNFWVLKLTSTGVISWQKIYVEPNLDEATSIRQTSDGGYIVAGYADFPATDYDFWVLKLNSSGTPSWQKTYGGDSEDQARSIQQTSDGGYIVAGHTWSFGAGSADFWVLKLNSDGTVAWEKRYDVVMSDYATSIQETSDGGYIVAGYTYSSVTNWDAWVLKLNSDGTVAWQKRYGGGNDDRVLSIQQISDGGYIVAGCTDSFGAGSYDLWVLKLTSTGTVSWQKTYGGTGADYAYSIQQTSGGYIVAGATYSFGVGAADSWVLKLNSDGTISWQKTYGGINDDYAYSIQRTSDGSYIVAGFTTSFGADYDFWVLKLNSDGTIVFDPLSGAQVIDTSVVPADTSATVADTTATVANTSATVTDTSITPVDTNATVTQQAP